MDRENANQISELIRLHANDLTSFHLEEVLEAPFSGFAFVKNQECVGAYRIASDASALYFLLIEWNPERRPKQYYLVVYRSNRNGPVCEIHELRNKRLAWMYSPTKRDKKNQERKEMFEVLAAQTGLSVEQTEVTIRQPETAADLDPFFRSIFQLVETREKADALRASGPVPPQTENTDRASGVSDAPLNVILYGPPGTGKTFATRKRCVELCLGEGAASSAAVDRHYLRLVEAGRVVFVTFHQSYTYEEFIEGLRPTSDDDGTPGFRLECRDGILKQLARRAKTHVEDPADVDFDLAFELLLNNGLPRTVTTKSGVEYTMYAEGDDALRFVGSAQSERLVHKGELEKLWAEILSEGRSSNPALLRTPQIVNAVGPGADASYIWIAYKELLAAWNASRNPLGRAAFVLVIDEINRANISKVMGELITLLEEDKREGQPNEITVTLPYSGDQFALPPNLYILGTMNTADRSIALLDIALRRRFQFEEIAPQPTQLEDAATRTGIELPEVLRALNDRLEYLIDRDHLIGHAWLMTATSRADVDDIFRQKIIPLLAEYFYEDWSKVQSVLGGGGDFVRKQRLNPPPGHNGDEAEERYRWEICADFPDSAYERLIAG